MRRAPQYHSTWNPKRWMVAACRHTPAVVSAMLLIAITGLGHADETRPNPVGSEPPKLQPIFSDDFSTDTRGDYQIKGKVSWESGTLGLAKDASLTRQINSGGWIQIDLHAGVDNWLADTESAELRIWFVLHGATDCMVRLHRPGSDNTATALTATFIDTVEKDGQLTGRLVRKAVIKNSTVSHIRISYRRGLVKVAVDGVPSLTGYVQNGDATVQSVRLHTPEGSHLLQKIICAGTAAPAPLTDRQKALATEALAAGQRLISAFQQGDYADAAASGERALELRRAAVGENHPDCATSLNDLAVIYFQSGDTRRAEPLMQQANSVFKTISGEDHPEYAGGLNNLASLYIGTGRQYLAEPLLLQASEIWKSTLGSKALQYATCLSNLASLYKEMGDYPRAQPFFRECLEIRKMRLGDRHADYASSLNALAENHLRLGEFNLAEPLFQQALEIRENTLGQQHPAYAASLSNLAQLYSQQGDNERALPLLEETAQIEKQTLGEQHTAFATTLNNLAAIYKRTGDDDRAELLYERALNIRRDVLGEEHSDFAQSLNNLAQLYRSRKEFGRAEPLLRQALQIYQSIGGDQHPLAATALNNLAGLHFQMGDPASAEKMYLKALETRRLVLGENHADYAQSLSNLAFFYSNTGQNTRAHPLYQQALEIQRANLNRNSVIQSARQQLLNQSKLRFYLDSSLTNALVLNDDSKSSLEDIFQWKGAVTARQKAYRQVASNAQLAPAFDELQAVTRQLSAHSGRIPLAPSMDISDPEQKQLEQARHRWQERFDRLNSQKESLEQQIARQSTQFRRIREPLKVSHLQQWLPDKTAYVEFLEYVHHSPEPQQPAKTSKERRHVAFVVRSDQEPAMIGMGSAAASESAIIDFRRQFQSIQLSTQERETAATAAAQLRASLWQPIEAHLDGINTVIISPDTSLGSLPFNALPGKKPGSFLIEDYRIALLPMANQMWSVFEDKSPQPERHGLLAVGDVDYAHEFSTPSVDTVERLLLADAATQQEAAELRSTDAFTFTSLPGFRKELDLVSRLYRSSFPEFPTTVLSGKETTESNFLRQSAATNVLHVITHGYFAAPGIESIGHPTVEAGRMATDSGSGPPIINMYPPGLLSGLALAGANNPSDDPEDPRDGILRASEIEASSLQSVDLVVLSACETGLGKVAGGEGLTGLQRAFHVAGARSVIASLWKVDDAATTELMRLFYSNLWEKKLSKLDALREAQLTMLNHYDAASGQLRGLGGNKVNVSPDKPVPKPDKTKRLDPRYWAAFQLSGDWR